MQPVLSARNLCQMREIVTGQSAGKRRSIDWQPAAKARENMQQVLNARNLCHKRERVTGEKRGKTVHRPATTGDSAGKHASVG